MKQCLIIFLAVFTSCANKGGINFKPFNSDTSKLRQDQGLLDALPAITRKLGLAPLNTLSDSFGIRMWLPVTTRTDDYEEVITLCFNKGGWTGTKTTFWERMPEHTFRNGDTVNYFRQVAIDSIRNEPLPAEKVAKLATELARSDIQNSLPNATIEGNSNPATDGPRYLFEFYHGSRYRVVHYSCSYSRPSRADIEVKVGGLVTFINRLLALQLGECP